MADNAYHGKHGRLYHGSTDGGAAVASAVLTEWTYDMSAAFSDATTQGNSNQRFTPGIPNAQGTLAGYWDSSDDAAFDASELNVPVKAYFYPSTIVTACYWYGNVWIRINTLTVNKDNTVSFTASWAAAGDMTRKTA